MLDCDSDRSGKSRGQKVRPEYSPKTEWSRATQRTRLRRYSFMDMDEGLLTTNSWKACILLAHHPCLMMPVNELKVSDGGFKLALHCLPRPLFLDAQKAYAALQTNRFRNSRGRSCNADRISFRSQRPLALVAQLPLLAGKLVQHSAHPKTPTRFQSLS